ncbi:MAG: hypothetical protein AAB932_04335 [Patescibacteria group bacterium]
MKSDDKRKIINRKSAVKTTVGLTAVVIILRYLEIQVDVIILILLLLQFGILTYFMSDYDDDIEDIKNRLKHMEFPQEYRKVQKMLGSSDEEIDKKIEEWKEGKKI